MSAPKSSIDSFVEWKRVVDELKSNPIISEFLGKIAQAMGTPVPTLDYWLEQQPEEELQRAWRAHADQMEFCRARYSLGLQAVAQLLNRIGGDGVDDLIELASALSDLNNGVVRNFLLPARRGRADPSNIWRARALICLAAEALYVAGETRLDAAARIVDQFPEFDRMAGKKAYGKALEFGVAAYSKTVENWRDNFRKGKVRNEEAQHSFTESYLQLKDRTLAVADLRSYAAWCVGEARALSAIVSSPPDETDAIK